MSSDRRNEFATEEVSPAAPSELLHSIFEQQALKTPERVALICGAQALTYGELNQRANELACLLRAHGTGRGDCVGLLAPRSAEAVIGLLGILKTGSAYVPIDPDYPPERVAFILNDCRAKALVSTTALIPNAGQFSGTCVLLDERRDPAPSLS